MKKIVLRIINILKSIKFSFKSHRKLSLPRDPEFIIESERPTCSSDYCFEPNNESSNITLTIGITTFNSSKWIQNTIATIKNQPFRESVEVVFVDNASTDDTVDIIKELVKDLKFPYKIIVNENNGMAGFSRTKVIENSNGRFVLFVDGDDGLNNGSIDRILSIIKQEPDLDLIQLGPISFPKKDVVITNYKQLYSLGGMPGGKVINRLTWSDLCFPINCNFEDTVFPLGYYFRVRSAYISSTNDYWIRPVNPESLSRKKSPSFLDHVRVVMYLYDKLQVKNEFTYCLLLRHFGMIAYERLKSFDMNVQLAAFAIMRLYVINNMVVCKKMPRKYKMLESSFVKGNYYHWVATIYRYF